MAQEQLWITQFGTSDHDRFDALLPDGSGGVFASGRTLGSLGGSSAGWTDALLARFDSAGNQIWMRQFGTSVTDYSAGIATDGSGGVYIAGLTDGWLSGPSFGGNDAFVARYDGEGNQAWVRQFGTNERDYCHDLASDGAGGVFIGGQTAGSLGGPHAGGWDGFLARYDREGRQIWIQQFGTASSENAWALAPDESGGVFVGGFTLGSLGGSNAGHYDAYVAHFDHDGSQTWIRQFGTATRDDVYALAPDGAGGVFVGGSTAGSLVGTNAGQTDCFLAHFDAAGNQVWIKQFGTIDSEWIQALAYDGAGGVIVGGPTYGSLGGPNVGLLDAFLVHYDSAGDQTWARQFGTRTIDSAYALASDASGHFIVTGSTLGSLGAPNAGENDIFMARYTDGSCYPDCDQSTGVGVLDIFDFLCWQNDFVTGNSYACDCDTSTGPLVCDLLDFLCFQSAFVAGCP